MIILEIATMKKAILQLPSPDVAEASRAESRRISVARDGVLLFAVDLDLGIETFDLGDASGARSFAVVLTEKNAAGETSRAFTLPIPVDHAVAAISTGRPTSRPGCGEISLNVIEDHATPALTAAPTIGDGCTLSFPEEG
jgi:hypothetical protein